MIQAPRTSSRPRSNAGGFTLIELMLAAAIVSVVLLGLQSAMLLASRANPDKAGAPTLTIGAATAADRVAGDLTFATSINSLSANSIEFIVPDRDGDGSPETIKYSWAGSAGNPLLCTINNRTPITVVPNVYEFALAGDKRSQTRSTTYTESGEVLLASNDGVSSLFLTDGDVDSNDFYGQYFKPTLPGSATSWRVTRVKFRARVHGGNSGSTRVELRNLNGGTPGTVIDEATMSENSLGSSYSWQEFAFANASGITPGSGLCLVLQWVSDTDSCDVQYQAFFGSQSNAAMLHSSNAGQSWSYPSAQQLIYYVYGTYSTPDTSASDYWWTDVRMTLRCGTDTSKRVNTSVRLFNEPQVAG